MSRQDALKTKRQSTTIQVRCPSCHNPIDVSIEGSFESVRCDACGSQFSLVSEIGETRDAAEIETLGHFELIEWLGTGGFGTVWKARDTKLDRIVAVKIPQKGQLSVEEQEKFLREARAAAQLKHPNIVTIHEIGRAGDTVYIVSDMVHGVSLADWLTAKQVNARESAELCVKMADALEHSHQAGVVHRDLKPKNIMIDADGEPHLTDFGLARREFGEITMTVEGQVLGTPAYMPPEQASGEGHRAGNRADIYSLGVILFRLLTGELPFRGNARMLIQQVLHDEPPSPRKLNSSIPRDLETICLKCLEKEPSKRYQRARLVADELQRFLRNEPIRTRPLTGAARAWRWCKRNPSVAGLLAAVVCVLLTGTAVSLYFATAAIDARDKLARVSSGFARITTDSLAKREETEGYRQEVWDLIKETLELGGNDVDTDQLRRTAVTVMGDFAGLQPVEHLDFPSNITAFRTHPTGKSIAVGLKNGEIRFVQPLGKPLPEILSGHDCDVIGLAFNEGGNELISVDARGGVQYWGEYSGSQAWKPTKSLQIKLPPGTIEALRFTPDLNYVLASSMQGAVLGKLPNEEVIWDVESTKQQELAAAACSPDGRLLAVSYKNADYKFQIIITDRMKPDAQYEMVLDYGYTNALTFSPNGRHLVCGCEQAIVHFEVNPHDGDKFAFVQRPVVGTDTIRALTFSSDNQFLASVDIQGLVTVWTVSTGDELAVVEHRPIGRNQMQSLAFSADSQYLTSANVDSVKVWNFAGATERKVFSGHAGSIPSIAYGPKGDLIVTGGKDNRVVVWNSQTGAKLSELNLDGKVQCVAIDAEAKWLATAEWFGNKSIQIWRIRFGKIDTSRPIVSIAHKLGDVNRLVFFGASNRLAAAGDDGVMYWDIQPQLVQDEPPKVISHAVSSPVPAQYFLDVAVSSDETMLAYSAEINSEIRIGVWNIKEGKSKPCGASPMLRGWHALAFIRGSHRLMFVNSDGFVETWDIDADVPFQTLDEETFGASHMALSKSGRFFAGLVKPRSVGIWDTTGASPGHLFDLRPERTAVWALAWSPDETRLALGLSDGGLTVWDLRSVNAQLADIGLDWQVQ